MNKIVHNSASKKYIFDLVTFQSSTMPHKKKMPKNVYQTMYTKLYVIWAKVKSLPNISLPVKSPRTKT